MRIKITMVLECDLSDDPKDNEPEAFKKEFTEMVENYEYESISIDVEIVPDYNFDKRN